MTIPAIKVASVVVASAATKSGELRLDGYRIVAIIWPVMTGTTLAFEAAAAPGGTFVPVEDFDSTPLAGTIASSTCTIIPPGTADDIGRLPVVKLVVATQGAERTISVVLERV